VKLNLLRRTNLKKSVFFLGIILLCCVVWGAAGLESEFYYKNILITKVYPHALGYKVMYMKGSMDLVEIYLPMKWFSASSGKDGQMAKGEVIYGEDSSYPYLSVYWKDGKFSHVRLFVKKNYSDSSWGSISQEEGLAKSFEVEELKLEF
jgi:hypothetical protein